MKSKLHLEQRAPHGTLFCICPALCGRKKPTDYRMYYTDDAISRRALRPFFARTVGKATCKACIRLYNLRKKK